MNAKATRAELIRVARIAFSSKGFAAVKLGEIARSAHATTGAIYHHFGGKAGLLLAVGKHVEEEVVAAIGARVPQDAAPWEAIRAAAIATLDLCSRPEVARIIFNECPNTLGAVAWREVEMRYGLGGLQALFRQAAEAGQLSPDDPALVARLFMAALIAAVDVLVENGAVDTGTTSVAIDRLLDAFRREDM